MEMNSAELAAVDGAACDLLDARGRLIITPNALTCDGQRNVPADLLPGESLEVFLRRHIPGIDSGAWTVMIGGATVPRTMWTRTWPKHGQLIACRASVGKQVVQLAAIAALSYFTMGMGGIAGGGFLGLKAGIGLAAAMGTFVAGSMLINKVLAPKVSKPGEAAAARQVYSLSGQRNSARAYEPLPVLWGEMRVTPDLAGQPYSWFEGDDQYLSTILLGGVNVHSVADLAIGDTPITSFEEVSTFFNGFSGMPSEDMPLYGNADSIAGGELENDGAWVTRTSSTGTITLQVDLEGQLYDMDGKGAPGSNSVPLFIETRPVGGEAWQLAHGSTLSNATLDVVRRTFTVPVPLGQHEVRVRLGAPQYNEGDGKDACKFTWNVLKSIQPDTTDYSGWGRIGIKIKATGQISGSLDTLRATYCARPLPVWSGTEWTTATTRAEGLSNPGAILLQTLRGVYANGVLQFGFGMSDEQIDIEGLKAFMLHCTARGYTYDRWVTGSMSLGAFCEEVALAGMGEFSWTDGSRPTAVFVSSGQPLSGVVNMANMLKGSFSVAYNLANAADGIEYQYLDRERNWETQTLRVAAPGVTTMLNPARITGEGVTTEAHAAVLARYHLAQSLYQYKTIDFGADIEHLAYRRLSVLSISHDLTQWGFGGRVMHAERVGAKVVLQLDEPVLPLAQAYVGLRVPGARDYRVFQVEAITAETDLITLVDAWPSGVAFPGEDLDNPAHDTLWCYDFKATPGYRVRVVGMQPEADLKGAQVSCVPEGPEFWDYVLNGNYVPAPNQSSLPQLGRPSVSNLRITEQVNVQGDTEWYSLNLVWDVEGAYDHAQVWAGRDGSELRMVDGNALGSRSSFRIDGAGAWLVEVRPFNAAGLAGQSATVLYITSRTQLPPRNVDDFVVQSVDGGLRRFAWQYTGDRPPAFAGVQIRYLPGDVPLSVADWDSMQPLGEADDVYRAQFETTRPDAGLWTFGCRAIDTAGQLANGVARFVANLADSFEQVQQPDMTPPPGVTGLAATAFFSAVLVEWDAVAYDQGHGHARTIIYAAQGDEATFEQAKQVAEAYNGPVSFASEPDTVWQIWAKNQTNDDVLSVAPAGPVRVRTAEDVDKVLDALHGKLSQDQMVLHLAERFDLIDGVGPGSVNARVAAERAARMAADIAQATEQDAKLAQEELSRSNAIIAEQQARAAADALEAQMRASAIAEQTQNLGNAVTSLTTLIQTGDSSLSARVDTVTATNLSRPNLLPGLTTWTLSSAFSMANDVWGEALYVRVNGTHVAVSPQVPAQAGVGYVLTFDSLRFAQAGSLHMDMQFFNGSGVLLQDSGQVPRFDTHDFRADDQNRLTNAYYEIAPANTAYIKVRAVLQDGAGVTAVGWRQAKLERGTLPATRYTDEAQTTALNAAIIEERSARVSADSAEAQLRTDLAVQMRGNATGSDLESVSTGLIAQEKNARVSADNSLAYQMVMLSAGVGEQFDSAKMWFFDTSGDAEGWVGRSAMTVANGFMRLPNSASPANFESATGLGIDAAKYRQIKLRLRKTGSPAWLGRAWWRRTTDALFEGSRMISVPAPTYDANGIALVTWDMPWDGVITAINFDLYVDQTAAAYVEIDWIAIGRPSPGASNAVVQEEALASTARDSALASARTALSVALTGLADPQGVPLGNLASGLLADERNARVSADSAEVIARQNLATSVAQGLAAADASLQAEQLARSSADSAEAANRLALRAELYSRRNMVPDVFDWGPLPAGWSVTEVADWGVVVFCGDGSKIPAVGNVTGPVIAVQPNVAYTIAGDTLLTATGGFVAFDLIFRDAAGQPVMDGPEQTRTAGHDFSADGSGRKLTQVAATAPAGAVTAVPRFWWGNVTGPVNIGFRQVKVERGGLPATPYSSEAEAQVLNANIVEESYARAQADAAEAYARQQLEAAYNASNVELYGKISTEQQVRADADSVLASQITTLGAASVTRPNLQFNGGFEFGLEDWTGSVDGWNVIDDAWGRSIGNGTLAGTGALYGRAIPAMPGRGYSVACDTRLFAASGEVSIDLQFYNAAGAVLLDGSNSPRLATHDFSVDNTGRRAIQVFSIAPEGTGYVRARLVWVNIQGLTTLGFRQIKVEAGGLPATAYTAEGSLVSSVAAIKTEAQARAEGDEAEAYQRTLLASTVETNRATLQAAIQSEETTRANADSALASQVSTLSASVAVRPNICPDVDRWALGAGMAVLNDSWGKHTQVNSPANGTFVCDSPKMPVAAGANYVVTGDSLMLLRAGGTGACYFDMRYYNASGALVGDGGQVDITTSHDFDSTGANRKIHAVQSTAPANAVECIARFVATFANCSALGFRQVKVERGSLPASPYTVEGEVAKMAAALQVEQSVRADETGALFGRYSVKIDLNGYMTGYGLLAESNNGVNTSTFAVRADRFVIGDASNNAVRPFVVEGGRVYMDSAVIRDATIKNAMIENGTIQNAKIVSIAASKLTSGYIEVGNFIASTGYESGAAGWAIWGNGNSEFNNITVRGTVFATAGQIAGWRINSDQLLSGAFTGFSWPAAGVGVCIAHGGILLGNLNIGQYLHLTREGNLYAPGFRVENGSAVLSGSLDAAKGTFAGSLTAQAVNAVDTINIAGNAVTVPLAVSGGTYIGSGANVWSSINRGTISMSQGGFVTGLLVAVQNHISNSNSWRMRMEIWQGSLIGAIELGGQALTVSPTISLSRPVAAGNAEVVVKWWGGDANCRIESSELLILGVKR